MKGFLGVILGSAIVCVPVARLNAACSSVTLNTGATIAGIPVSSNPSAVITGEFDAYAGTDFVFSDFTGNKVYLVGLSGATPLAGTFASPVALASADFNNDGFLDVAVASTNFITVDLLSASGSVDRYTLTGAATQLNGIAAGDLNNDGKPDLAVADYSGAIRVYTGSGTGTFSAGFSLATPGGTPFDIAISDVNRDGKADLIVSDSTLNTVTVYAGDGSATSFTALPSTTLAGSPRRIAVADFRRDGTPDIAASIATGGVVVLIGFGQGASYSLQPPAMYSAPNGTWGILGIDVNDDGRADIVTTNSTSGSMSVLLNTGLGTFGPAATFPVGSNPLSLAASATFDLQHATYNAYTDTMPEFRVANFASASVTAVANLCSPRGADVNGDGDIDGADVMYLINFLFAGGAPPVY